MLPLVNIGTDKVNTQSNNIIAKTLIMQRCIMHSHDLSKFDFRHTNEDKQDIGYALELINLANLDDKLEPLSTPCVLTMVSLINM